MIHHGHRIKLPKEQVTQGFALCVLLAIAGLAIAGPNGLLAWSENAALLDQREARIEALIDERRSLKNRVNLLSHDHADPDMTSELLRSNLNVIHPDELVLTLPEAAE